MSPDIEKAFEITKQIVTYVDSRPRSEYIRFLRERSPNGSPGKEAMERQWDAWRTGDSIMSLADICAISHALNCTPAVLLQVSAPRYREGSAQASKPRRSPS